RWELGQSVPSSHQLRELARAVFPIDPKLAEACALASATTLEALGIVQRRPPPSAQRLADSVVCAAAEAMNVPPTAIRHALLAAFQRAVALDLDLSTLIRGLSPPS